MRLSQPVYDNGYVAIAEFPYAGETMPNGFTCYITGWGLIDCKKTLMITYVSNAHHLTMSNKTFLHYLFTPSFHSLWDCPCHPAGGRHPCGGTFSLLLA